MNRDCNDQRTYSYLVSKYSLRIQNFPTVASNKITQLENSS